MPGPGCVRTVAYGQHEALLHAACLRRSHGQTLQVMPGVPEAFSHTVAVAVAHLEPARLAVSGTGALPSVVLTLPRAPGAARARHAGLAAGVWDWIG